jgi:hypothetical protein
MWLNTLPSGANSSTWCLACANIDAVKKTFYVYAVGFVIDMIGYNLSIEQERSL